MVKRQDSVRSLLGWAPVTALVHAPAAFRRRGVFVADYEIDAA